MLREAPVGLADYAINAPDANMRYFADVANRRGMTLRDLAALMPNREGGVGVYASTVTRHMNALKSTADTVARYEKALGLDNRKARVQRGSDALNQDDLRHFRRLFLRAIAMSDTFEDPTRTLEWVTAVLDGSRESTRREVLREFATTDDISKVLGRLTDLTGTSLPSRTRFTASDQTFWMIALELRDFGLSEPAIKRVLKLVAKESGAREAVQRNREYLETSYWGKLAIGDESQKSEARAAFSLESEDSDGGQGA
jgi:hypothetical protein